MTVVALIPARGGSKGIPRKNIAPLAGRPLIAWTITAALASGRLQRVIVSTDDEEIAHVAREHGAEVPFLRPPELAGDESTAVDVALHALDALGTPGPDALLLLQPTSPLRSATDICDAIDLAEQSQADAVIGICEATPHPYLARSLDADGKLRNFSTVPPQLTRRQDYPPAYVLNGAIYLNRCASLRATRSFEPPGALGFIMPPERSIDIDAPLDLQIAESLLKNAGY